MTLNELNSKIAASPNAEWYQKYSIKLDYSHINFHVILTGVPTIYEFVLNQIDGFESLGFLPSELETAKTRFISAKRGIIQLLKNEDVSNHSWTNNLDTLTNNNRKLFIYDAPETAFLARIGREQDNYYEGAYNYIIGNLSNLNQKNHFTGAILAYEFTLKDHSALTERRDAEKKSILKIRADFQAAMETSKTQLVDHLKQANDNFAAYVEKIDLLKMQKETLFNDWFEKSSKDFTQFRNNSNDTVKSLEDLYQQKLKLEAPANYWQQRAKSLRKEGRQWLLLLVSSVCIAIIVLIWILNQVSNGSLYEIFKNTGTAIKWSVILITIISLLAFVIRIFSKLAFSAYHLVRDAEEREQLTYVYLALQKEKGIDQTERHLIMQSLFSRADSGLLKEDAAPTMPGNIVDKVIR